MSSAHPTYLLCPGCTETHDTYIHMIYIYIYTYTYIHIAAKTHIPEVTGHVDPLLNLIVIKKHI